VVSMSQDYESDVNRLTIAIPTYNRNQILLENILLLLPQLDSRCRLLIVDNCSDVPVEQTLQGSLHDRCAFEWKIVRNSINIGVNANVLRCFELCESRWLWVLGDDDQVYPDAISKLFAALHTSPSCIFYNFSSEIYFRTASHMTHDLTEFVAEIDDFSNVLFLSTGVYDADKLRPHLVTGYLQTGSHAPHLAMLMSALKQRESCLLSDQAIVHHDNNAAIRWSYVAAVIGWYDLLDLLQTKQERYSFSRTLASVVIPTLPNITKQLVLMGLNERNTDNALHYFGKIMNRMLAYDNRLSLRVKLIFYSWIIRNPKLFVLLYDRIRGRDVVKDEFKAMYS
jgi:glycosyltransferase involved in cell wall biosynthesis